MHEIIFYPIGNGEACLIKLNNGRLIAFDYADLANPNDPNDRRMPLRENFKQDIGWYGHFTKRRTIDVLAITHGDLDHVKAIPEHFWLRHAKKYQSDDRIKFDEMWVPAALIVEEGSEEDTRIIRQEARHRFLAKEGILVFSRPEALNAWLQKQPDGVDKNIENYRHLCRDAGTLVPSFSKAQDGVEFFIHSPFASRTEDGLLDRNADCIVVQAVFVEGGRETKVLLSGDIPNKDGEFDEIIRTTKRHGKQHRLEWDVLDVPHHCSYLSLAPEKGTYKTKPTEEVKWLLEQGTQRSIMVCSSKEIPAETTDQPPHVETLRAYKEYCDAKDGDWRVTMEFPSKQGKVERTRVEITANGAKLIKHAGNAAPISTTAVRAG